MAGDWMINANGLAVSLDRKEKGATVDFISHAHTDHIASAKSSKSVLASKETIDLLQEFRGIGIEQVKFPYDSIRLIDAGHMLGSKQIVINDETAGKKIIYTGDFQLQKSRAANEIQIEEADTVIVDSTYFDPAVKFDPRGETESALQLWTEQKLMSGIPLFGTYSVGKAQELIAILNEVGIVPIVSKKISAANKIYVKNGVKLDYASAYDPESDYEQLTKGNFVAIGENYSMPTLRAQLNALYNKQVFTAVATGMALTTNFNTDVQFALSDHADFGQVIDYIDATGAKEIFSYGHNANALSNNLINKGYSALSFNAMESPNLNIIDMAKFL